MYQNDCIWISLTNGNGVVGRFGYICNVTTMKPEKHISTPDPKVVAILKRMIADKKIIHEHIRNGKSLSELAPKGFKFVKFL